MIYTVKNTSKVGRPVKVFVNGNEVNSAIFADTDRGLVRYAPRPYRVMKGRDFLYTRLPRGKVTVEELR